MLGAASAQDWAWRRLGGAPQTLPTTDGGPLPSRRYAGRFTGMSSGLRGFLERSLEEQNVFEHGLEELFLVVGELELEQAAGGLVEVLDGGLQLAAQAIDLGAASAGGVGGQEAGAEQFGFEAFAFGLFALGG